MKWFLQTWKERKGFNKQRFVHESSEVHMYAGMYAEADTFKISNWSLLMGAFVTELYQATLGVREGGSQSNKVYLWRLGDGTQPPTPSQSSCELYTFLWAHRQPQSPGSHSVPGAGQNPGCWRFLGCTQEESYTPWLHETHGSGCSCDFGQKWLHHLDIQRRPHLQHKTGAHPSLCDVGHSQWWSFGWHWRAGLDRIGQRSCMGPCIHRPPHVNVWYGRLHQLAGSAHSRWWSSSMEVPGTSPGQ